MKKQTFITVAIASALALVGCTLHPASTAVAATLSPATHNPVAEYSDPSEQLADGLYHAGLAAMAIENYYVVYGKLPASTDQAESAEPWYAPKFDSPEAQRNVDADSVEVGPAPGVVTVTWARGELAGKSLALVPERPSALNPICFRVNASTTVPAATLAPANIVNRCLDDNSLHEAVLGMPER